MASTVKNGIVCLTCLRKGNRLRRRQGQSRLKNDFLYFTYELRDTLKSLTLFFLVKTISKLNFSLLNIERKFRKIKFKNYPSWLKINLHTTRRMAKKCAENSNAGVQLLVVLTNEMNEEYREIRG